MPFVLLFLLFLFLSSSTSSSFFYSSVTQVLQNTKGSGLRWTVQSVGDRKDRDED